MWNFYMSVCLLSIIAVKLQWRNIRRWKNKWKRNDKLFWIEGNMV